VSRHGDDCGEGEEGEVPTKKLPSAKTQKRLSGCLTLSLDRLQRDLKNLANSEPMVAILDDLSRAHFELRLQVPGSRIRRSFS
jgi:hypothetical protein